MRWVATCCSVMSRAVPRMPFTSRVLVEQDACIDADPAVFAARRDDVRHVILDFAAALQHGEEAPVRDVRVAGFEIEEAAADEVARRQAENVLRGGIQIGEAALRVGRPDEIVRRFHEVAVAVLAFEQQLDDAAFFGEAIF